MRHLAWAWAITVAALPVLLGLPPLFAPVYSQHLAEKQPHHRASRQPAASDGGPPESTSVPGMAIINITTVAAGTSCPAGLTAEPQATQLCVATSKLEGLAPDTPLVSNLVLISASSIGQQARPGCTTPPCLTTCPPGYELVEGPPLNSTSAGEAHVCAAFASAAAASRSSLVVSLKVSEPRFCNKDKDGWMVVPQPARSGSDGREQQPHSIVGPLPQQPVLCQQRLDPAGVTAVPDAGKGDLPLLRLHPSRWGHSHCLQRAAASTNLSAAAQVGLCPTSSCSSSWTSATTLVAVAVEVPQGAPVARVHSLWNGKHPAPIYTLRVGGPRSLQCLALDPSAVPHAGGQHSSTTAQQTGVRPRRAMLQAELREASSSSSSRGGGAEGRSEAHGHSMPVVFMPCAASADQVDSLMQQVWSILPHPQVPGTLRVVSRAAHRNTSHHRCLHLAAHARHPSMEPATMVAGSCRGPGATWVLEARSSARG